MARCFGGFPTSTAGSQGLSGPTCENGSHHYGRSVFAEIPIDAMAITTVLIPVL